jgi:hypothetical protein
MAILSASAVRKLARDQGREPRLVDVQSAAVQVTEGPDAARARERQEKEVLAKIDGMTRGLKLELAPESLTPDFRRRLLVALVSLGEALKILLQAIQPDEATAPKDKKESARAAEINRLHQELSAQAAPKTKARKQTPEDQARIIREAMTAHHNEEPRAKRSLRIDFKPGKFPNVR